VEDYIRFTEWHGNPQRFTSPENIVNNFDLLSNELKDEWQPYLFKLPRGNVDEELEEDGKGEYTNIPSMKYNVHKK
jgi:hypothetical protein